MKLLELVTVAVLIAVALYARDLYRRPYRWHRKCKGTGRVGGSTSKRYGVCSCVNEPRRLRIGAQLVRPGLRKEKR